MRLAIGHPRVDEFGLNIRQRAFAEQYLLDLNATAAYLRAGYVAKNNNVAAASSSALLRIPKVAAYIGAKIKKVQGKLGISLERTLMEILWFAPDWGGGARDPLWDIRIANFDRIAAEDILFAEPMQTTIESPGFRGVPLSYQERRIYHWHEEIDRRIGIDKIPPALRVEPRLAAWLE